MAALVWSEGFIAAPSPCPPQRNAYCRPGPPSPLTTAPPFALLPSLPIHDAYHLLAFFVLSYQRAVEESEAARADITLAQNERDQELTKANIQYDKAFQLARATMSSANTTANIIVAFATADATAVKERYKAYEDSYSAAKETHGLSIPGILSYFGTQMINSKSGPNQVHNLPSTAKLDYKDEL